MYIGGGQNTSTMMQKVVRSKRRRLLLGTDTASNAPTDCFIQLLHWRSFVVFHWKTVLFVNDVDGEPEEQCNILYYLTLGKEQRFFLCHNLKDKTLKFI